MNGLPNHDVNQFSSWIRAAFDSALSAGQPLRITQSACQTIAAPTAVIALGKAAGAMAEGARAAGVTAPGIIITTDENHRQIEGFDCIAASHPCLLYTSPSPRDGLLSRMPSSA